MLYLLENCENINLSLTGGSWRKSASIRPADVFSIVIMNTSPNLESIPLHKSFYTIESSF